MDQTIAIVGAGAMGTQIGQLAAERGFQVLLFDTKPVSLGSAVRRISHSTVDLIKTAAPLVAAPLVAAPEKPAQRVQPLADLVAAAGANLVIESITENEAEKRAIWTRLDNIPRPEAIFASNTSALSITRLASATKRPERFIGMHFFKPVAQMKLVEIVRGAKTSDATCNAAKDAARKLGKVPVEAKDFPGFVSNRVLMPMLNEAMFAVYEGVATPEAVDEIFRLGMNHPMGPLALADFIGLDACLNVMETLQAGFGDSKYRPCPLLRQMVATAGKTGRKGGEGFFKYGG